MFVKGSCFEFTRAIGGRACVVKLSDLVVSIGCVIRSANSAPQVGSCLEDPTSVTPCSSVNFLLHWAETLFVELHLNPWLSDSSTSACTSGLNLLLNHGELVLVTVNFLMFHLLEFCLRQILATQSKTSRGWVCPTCSLKLLKMLRESVIMNGRWLLWCSVLWRGGGELSLWLAVVLWDVKLLF